MLKAALPALTAVATNPTADVTLQHPPHLHQRAGAGCSGAAAPPAASAAPSRCQLLCRAEKQLHILLGLGGRLGKSLLEQGQRGDRARLPARQACTGREGGEGLVCRVRGGVRAVGQGREPEVQPLSRGRMHRCGNVTKQ